MSDTTTHSRQRHETEPAPPIQLDRRRFMGFFSAAGLGGTLFPGVLWARLQEQEEEEPQITSEMIADAEAIAGLEFTDEEREMMRRNLDRNLRSYVALREVEIPNDVPPALLFDPLMPGVEADLGGEQKPIRVSPQSPSAAAAGFP